MPGPRWSEQEDLIIGRLFRQEKTSNEIGKVIGRSGNSVLKRLARLGLTRDQSHLADVGPIIQGGERWEDKVAAGSQKLALAMAEYFERQKARRAA